MQLDEIITGEREPRNTHLLCRRRRRCIAARRRHDLLLSRLVVGEIVKDARLVAILMQDLHDLLSLLRGHLLRVARVRHRLVLVVLQPDVPQLAVGHVLHVDPLHLELSLPLVLRPHLRRRVVVDGRHHLRHAAEVSRAVDAVQEVDGALGLAFAVRRIQVLVAVLRAAPDRVLDRAVDVVLRVALYDKVSRALQGQVELLLVILVRHS